MLSEAQSLAVVKQRIKDFPDTLVMLGTGWNQVLNQRELEIETEINFKQLFGVEATVPGHEGKLIVAKLNGRRTAFMQGRLHLYEGYTAREATLPIRVFAQAGMKRLVITSASGGLNPKYRVGDVVVLSDLLTLGLVLDNPLVGPQFVDMSEVFDLEWRGQAVAAAAKLGINVQQGVYAYYHGPNFETPTDKLALRALGADVCGMSTVPEAIQAKALGVKILGLSCVTNLAFVKHSHQEVLAAAENVGEKLGELIIKKI